MLDSNDPKIVAGEYELVVTSSQVLINQVQLKVDISIESTYINEYVIKELPEQQGNLFDNDIGAEYWSEISINGQQMYLRGDLGGVDDSIVIEGQYGTLTLLHDGDYIYVAKGSEVGSSD